MVEVVQWQQGDQWNEGTFAGGADVLSGGIGGGLSARVDGLWLQYDRDKAAGRCGWWVSEKADLDNGGIYVISVSYRTMNLSTGTTKVRLSSGYAADLPATHRSWKHFVYLIQDGNMLDEVQPLLRIYAPGQAWFDNMRIKSIRVENGSND